MTPTFSLRSASALLAATLLPSWFVLGPNDAGAGEPAAADCPRSAPFSAGWNTGLPVAGQSRAVYVIPPSSPSPSAPLFIAFNGTGEDGLSFSRRARLEDWAARGFWVFAPSSNANGTFWPVWDGLRDRGHEEDPNPDLALFDTLLACGLAHHAIDPTQVYAGGHSAGGIFTNYLVQRRSEQLAGVIVASGLHSQTAPAVPRPLDPLTVIITYGGENDRWSGRAGKVQVKDISFPSEAAVAGQVYVDDPGVDLYSCFGHNLGHAWLDDINSWMIDRLLGRPKGAPAPSDLPPLPAGTPVTCQRGPTIDRSIERISCPESPVVGCQAFCQQIADGAATNRTVGPVLRSELRALGFAEKDCSACVAHCSELATRPPDQDALQCAAARPAPNPAQGGIAGAIPLIDTINTCCGPAATAAPGGWCATLCTELRGNLAARSYFSSCPSTR